ncbi:Uncharacterised protein [Mycobacteroides abscessus subsp. abscessus]|nr:Uncharacterised protein [Mycobacteroides abscessus subsp. abscessus]
MLAPSDQHPAATELVRIRTITSQMKMARRLCWRSYR